MREVTCPSCGAAVKFVSAASLLAVCPYCRATLINRELTIENVGRMGFLLPDPTPLQLGAEGTFRNVHFAVIGRIQVQYEAGAWNEWYLAFDDGRTGWLGEAEGLYSVYFETRQKVELPVWEKVKPGLSIHIGGFDYEVTDVRPPRVVGGEGELPFVIASGYEARVADLRTTTDRCATLDYSEEVPRVFLGEIVEFGSLAFRGLREQAPTGPTAAGRALACSKCGAALTVRAPGKSLAVVCSACGAILDASDPDARVIQEAADRQTHEPLLPLGSRGRFKGNIFEAVGFLVREAASDGTTYQWGEYVLFNQAQGFRWLSEYKGHWILSKLSNSNPTEGVGADNRRTATYLGSEYRIFQTAEATVAYVEGEFPWRVRLGEKAAMLDFVHPPLILSCEETAQEKTWSIGEHIEGEAVWKAFSLKGAPPRAEGVGVVQPSPFEPHVRNVARFTVAFIACAVAIQILAELLSQDRLVYEHKFVHAAGKPGAGAVVTEPFELTGRRSDVRIDIDTDLSNSWAYFNLALINEGSGRALNFGREVSYYFGSDYDGSWSEGGKRDDVYLPGVTSGRYYLLIDPETDPGRGFAYTVKVRRDVANGFHLFWALLLLPVPPLVFWFRKTRFEYKRWDESDFPMNVAETDDED